MVFVVLRLAFDCGTGSSAALSGKRQTPAAAGVEFDSENLCRVNGADGWTQVRPKTSTGGLLVLDESVCPDQV